MNAAAVESSFAARMAALSAAVAERSRPLPEGFVRCPFSAEHAVPLAALVSHILALHGDDALSAVPDAMYSLQTRERRENYLGNELYAAYTRTQREEGEEEKERCEERRTAGAATKHPRSPSLTMSSSTESESDD